MKLLNIAILLGLSAVLVAVYFFDPATESFFPPCPTNKITNLYCPGCGTLRALHALVHGDIGEAVSQNVLTVIFLPLIPVMMFFPSLFRSAWIAYAIFALFVIFAVLRNMEQFSFLAPH